MNERLLLSAGVAIAGYLISSALIVPARLLALRLGILDQPGERKCHHAPIPRLGGLAIYGSLVCVVWGSLFWFPFIRSSFLSASMHDSLKALSNYVAINTKLYALFVGATIVTAVGFFDDMYGVHFSPHFKLAGQTVAALILVAAGIQLDIFRSSPILCAVVTTIWLVGITNSFNLLDNMDGLSSGIALICASLFFVLVLLKGEFFIALLLSALIGSIVGFYQFNMRGGFIFMGDTGSLLLGYLLGAISVMAHYVDATDTSLFPIIAPIIILGLPLFDTFSVIIIRLKAKRSIFQGDQMHLSHRLVRIGMTKRQAVLFNYLMAFAIAANSLLILNSRLLHSIVAGLQVCSLISMVSILMTTRANNHHSG